MTYPKSSANKKSALFDLKQAFKANALIGAAALVFTVYQFVIYILGCFGDYINNAFVDSMNDIPASALSILGNAEYLEKFRKNTSVVCSLVGQESVYSVIILCAAIGAMFALCFAYSLKKKNVNFYYSSPVSRAVMFKNRITTAILWIVIVFAVPIVFDLLINIAFFGFSSYLVKMALALFAECLVYTLASFTICTIGMVACYTVIEGIFFAGTLYTFPTALMMVLDFICGGFLRGYNRSTIVSDLFSLSSSSNYFGDKSFLLETALFNPLLLGTKLKSDFYSDNIISLCYNYAVFDGESGKPIKNLILPDKNYIIPLLIWAVFIVLGMFLAKYIFTHKKMENASMHASNRFATGFFALQLSVGIAGFFAMTHIYALSKKVTQLIIFILMFVILVAVYYITVSICKRKAFHDVKTYVTPLIAGGVLGVACLLLGTGLFGFSQVPALDEIEYATVTANGMTDATYADTERGVFPFRDYYSENIIGVFSEKEDLEKFVKVAAAVSSAKDDDAQNCNITIVYRLKNGKIIKRRFESADKAAIYSLLSLTDTKEYKENLNNFILKGSEENLELLGKKTEIFDVDTGVFGGKFWTNDSSSASLANYETVELYAKSKKLFSIENSQELRKALAADFAQMTFEERFRPSEKEICRLSFVTYPDQSIGEIWDGKTVETEQDISYADSLCSYAVYPSMKNTVAYLNTLDEKQKEKVFASDFKFEDLAFVKANVLYYEDYFGYANYTNVFSGYDINYYDYSLDNSIGKIRAEITDKSKMEELFDLGKGRWYAEEGDLLVLLSTDNKNDSAEVQSVALIIPKDDIPNWLKAEIKK